jgi:beta-glucosidase
VPMDTMAAPVELPRARLDSIAAAARLVRQADAVILVLGEHPDQSGEAASRSYVELPGAQMALVRAVAKAAREQRKPVVALLTSGRALALAELATEVPAIVETWFLGVEHGNAVADVLLGRANPSGRLPVTFPRTTGQIPIHYDRRNTGRPPAENGEYTSKYLDIPWTPLYPFGHGLSYTTFGYTNVRVSPATVSARTPVTVEATVTNTGARAGEEVVQLYLRDDAASVTRPLRMLKGFQRVMLEPGQSRTVRFTLHADALAMYGPDMRKIVEPGTFTVWVGGSSAVSMGEGTRFEVTGDTLVLAPAPPRMR